ncbi:conserved hypothetical protein [Cupriavidus taiwanensis]|uniref:hypothetical protein n=1 Tax=Cupriavidus taiwanensis TaxID=164546 RepID=UPI000E15A636|nr:hypothetical protein [Cupriavidus taiwanensis]SPA23708.1 conserved hypothetical protein [Cupriavidus taiwanensis]
MLTIDHHRWVNCFSDVQTSGNGLRARAFLRDVVHPALLALDMDVEKWANSAEGGAPFAHADAQELGRTTTEAFCLAVHSLFERQVRRWLSGCVTALAFTQERIATVRKGNLGRLDGLLAEVRGIPMSAFYSFPDLKRLELLANACRHGDGEAAMRLYEQHPSLWPDWATGQFLTPGYLEPVIPALPPSFDSIVVPRHWLSQFVDAIAWFWDDTEYLYLNALQPHDRVLMRMDQLRQQRAARPPR